jgi:hypothetical protein
MREPVPRRAGHRVGAIASVPRTSMSPSGLCMSLADPRRRAAYPPWWPVGGFSPTMSRDTACAGERYAERLRRSLTSVRGTSVGLTLSRTTSAVITHSAMSDCEGSSYMVLSSTSSRMARRPRAPVARRIA